MTILRIVSAFAVLYLVELGDAVDQLGDLLAEIRGQLLLGVGGVLDGVVQQPGTQGLVVHAEFGQDHGDGQRMCDVRVAGDAFLAAMVVICGVEGALQQGDVGLGMLTEHDGQQRVEHALALRFRAAPSDETLPHPHAGLWRLVRGLAGHAQGGLAAVVRAIDAFVGHGGDLLHIYGFGQFSALASDTWADAHSEPRTGACRGASDARDVPQDDRLPSRVRTPGKRCALGPGRPGRSRRVRRCECHALGTPVGGPPGRCRRVG